MSTKILHTGQNDASILFSLPKHPFDYCFLMDVLKDYQAPRDKVGRLLKKQAIIRIKKGLYILSPAYGGQVDRRVVANLIYGPSYISYESALSYWGLIPERVEEITSVTNKRNKIFKTPLGIFSYTYLHSSKYYLGVDLITTRRTGADNGQTSFFIATREKALCDKIATQKGIATDKEVAEYFADDLRVDLSELDDLDLVLLNKVAKAYRKKAVTRFVRWITRKREES